MGRKRFSREFEFVRNWDLLPDDAVIRKVFGVDEAMRTVDLISGLVADPERPWVDWKGNKPLTPKQLGNLLRSFSIISETVHIHGLTDAKGYLRVRFEDAWGRYLPDQKQGEARAPPNLPSKRPSADETGVSSTFLKRPETSGSDGSRTVRTDQDGSKTEMLSHSHRGLDG
jgi:hypothetical protein